MPAPLQVATALAGVEAFLLVGYAVTLLATIQHDRVAMAVTTIGFFVVYGAALAWCAWQLRRLHSWARSFVVFAQLVQLGVAWSFHASPTTPVAVVMALVALVVLAGIFHPHSLRAVEGDPSSAG